MATWPVGHTFLWYTEWPFAFKPQCKVGLMDREARLDEEIAKW